MARSPLFKLIAVLQCALLHLVSFNGCATLITGTKQNIAIESEPSKANVRVETIGGLEVASGQTPMTVTLARKSEYMVIVKLSGYKEKRVEIGKEFNPVAVLSILAGVLGIFVDLATGAAWNLVPERIFVTLSTATLSSPEVIITVEYQNGFTKVIKEPLVAEEAK
mgnify:CR=1 FL=1